MSVAQTPKIALPSAVQNIIARLEENGFKAYAVGGAVRDSLSGKTPYDWDVATSARPEKIMDIFADYTVIPTGLKHGTVTVRVGKENFEITTFRSDGDYLDCRHPQNVEFVSDIALDLERRDFTINAMAYNQKDGLIDLYGGLADLNAKKLRAVGNAEQRFEEDALRILRCIRFVSSTGFDVEENTLSAMRKKAYLLKKVSAERLFAELDKTLVGEHIEKALTVCPEVLFEIIPELKRCYGFLQHTRWHLYDVYKHTVIATASIKADRHLRWCMLLHDIGKPDKFFIDDKGQGHFYGHPELSEQMAIQVFKRLKAPTDFTKKVCALIKLHDRPFSFDRRKLKKDLSVFGEETVLGLLDVKIADNAGQGTEIALAESEKVLKVKDIILDIINSGECYKLKDLKIDGKDVESFGFKGKEVGEILSAVLSDVIGGNLPNDRQRLLSSLEKRADNNKK